ncbi:MAG: hypothetical protein F4221_00415 [Rhodothermaceae bacterium]|nr:hypothetical protein [Rhodothermaceae bacterium]
MMRRRTFTYALTAVLLAFFLSANVSAQVRFAGNKKGLRVNGRIIDSSNLHESLHKVVEILRTQSGNDSFAAYTTGGFPMRARINGVVYEVWRDRIVESCDTLKANHEIQVGLQPSNVAMAQTHQRALTASGPQLGLPLLVSSFKGDSQQTDIFVNYGTPLDSIHDRSDGMTADYSIISTFVINDKGDTLVERTRNFNYSNMVKVFPDQDLWVDTQQMQVSSDEHDLKVVQKADGQTMDMRHRYIKVPDYGRAGLMLSSVMHAYSVERTENGVPPRTNEIVRRGFTILPAPRKVYSTEWPIYLYFEVYGLALNALGRTDYDVEITLEPKNADRRVRRLFRRNRDRGRQGVSVSYRGNGPEPEESLYQILDVSDQKTGFYTLTVSVRDNETGEESGRIQDLFLRRWGLSCSE